MGPDRDPLRQRDPRTGLLGCLLILLAVGVVMPAPANAQATGDARDDPTQIERRFEDEIRQLEREARPATPIPSVEAERAPASTAPIFTLTGVRIDGATVFSADKLSAAWKPYLGRMVSEADLGAITQAITRQYRDAGYPLSRAIFPPQDVQAGAVRLQVLEGYISEVAFGDDDALGFGLRPYADNITDDRPLRQATLERNLLFINDTPGVSIKDTTLQEIGGPTGRFRLTVMVETWKVWAKAALDNRGTSAVGPLQSSGLAALNSVFGMGETIAVAVQTVPDSPRELAFGAASVDVPIGGSVLKVGILGSYSEVRPSDERRLIDTLSFSETLGVRASLALYRSRAFSVLLRGDLQVRDAVERTDFGTTYHDRLRPVGAAADIQLSDSLGGETYLTVGLRQGLDILGASRGDDADLSRNDASGRFTKVSFDGARQQKIFGGLSVIVAASAQLASGPLLASEEFALGGARFGRGYDGGEISGDEGIVVMVELRYDGDVDAAFLEKYRLYGFFDAGSVWNIRPGSDIRTSLSSAGGGLKLFLPYGIEAGAEIAVPLTYRAISNYDRDPQLFFGVSKAFKFN